MMYIDYPHITGTSEERLRCIEKYLYRQAEILNYNLAQTTPQQIFRQAAEAVTGAVSPAVEPEQRAEYIALRDLIVKSADAFMQSDSSFTHTFDGEFVVQSEFGKFIQKTSNTVIANSRSITSLFSKSEEIKTDFSDYKSEMKNYISAGYDGDIFALDIGLLAESYQENGRQVENSVPKKIRITPDRLSFIFGNDEVAYLSEKAVFFPTAHITGGTINIANGTFIIDDKGKFNASNGTIGLWNVGTGNRYPENCAIYKGAEIDGVQYEVGLKAAFDKDNYANYYVAKKETDSNTWINLLWINNKGELISNDGVSRTIIGSGEISFRTMIDNTVQKIGQVKAMKTVNGENTEYFLSVRSSSSSQRIEFVADSNSQHLMYREDRAETAMSKSVRHSFIGQALFKNLLLCDNSIYTAKNFLLYNNDQYLFGKTTDGTNQKLVGVSKSNNVVVGYTTNVGNLKLLAKKDKTISLEAGTIKANTTTLATGSDLRIKNSVSDINEKYIAFFNLLHPVTFRYNDGQSGRLHIGFIAQEVLRALEDSGLTSQDFAGYVRAESEEAGLDGYELLIRYSEFTALNTFMIQKLVAENKQIKEELLLLKAERTA